MKTLSMVLGEHNVRANAILSGAVEGERIQRIFLASHAAKLISGQTIRIDGDMQRN